ncbi:two-component system, cell cycle response regulator [Gammaproteobacteria bacterium]
MSEPFQKPLTLLIVEDDPGDFGLIRAQVRLSGLERSDYPGWLIWAKSLAEGIEAARRHKPDLVLLDLSLPDSSGLNTVSALRGALPDKPLVVLTGHDDPHLANAALQAGAQDYLVKGQFEADTLGRTVRYALVRETLEARSRLFEEALNSAANGVFITDIEAHIQWVNPAFTALTGFSPEEALGRQPGELLRSGQQDQTFYQQLWDTILSGQVWQGEIVNQRKDGERYHEALTISPVLAKDGTIRHFVAIAQDISAQKMMEAELIHLATTDALTGLANRRHFLTQMEKELARLQRFGEPAALLMLDLDHFKWVNDGYGHAAGDTVLKGFAETLRETLRKVDLAGRLGGEEFAILLPGTDIQAAYLFAERLREQVARMAVEIAGKTLRVTVSIGIAVLTRNDASADTVLARADKALYRAKAGGRDRVEVSS